MGLSLERETMNKKDTFTLQIGKQYMIWNPFKCYEVGKATYIGDTVTKRGYKNEEESVMHQFKKSGTGELYLFDTKEMLNWVTELCEREGGGEMADLKPCPFCGGEAGMLHVSQLWEPKDSFWVQCKNPKCRMSGAHHKTEPEAKKAWNTRNVSEMAHCPKCGK